MDVRPTRDLYSRIKSNNPLIEVVLISGQWQKTLVVQPYFSNYFGTNEKLKFVSCKMYVTHGGYFIEVVDLMDKLTAKDGLQSLDYGEPTKFDYDVRSVTITPVPTMPIYSDGWYGPKGEVYIIATDAYGFEYVF